ncbi:hypothetical protein OH76DRAFT_704859 [Lentinus brumalis]|uniref:Secreted protein n=1 Tax=Lentinus brumalis TaxID=2498619 RepID=A0A371D5X5_9APHY|nr:hypothetical protein OH76DRAFT_704859 [Polyporus brumalis]
MRILSTLILAFFFRLAARPSPIPPHRSRSALTFGIRHALDLGHCSLHAPYRMVAVPHTVCVLLLSSIRPDGFPRAVQCLHYIEHSSTRTISCRTRTSLPLRLVVKRLTDVRPDPALLVNRRHPSHAHVPCRPRCLFGHRPCLRPCLPATCSLKICSYQAIYPYTLPRLSSLVGHFGVVFSPRSTRCPLTNTVTISPSLVPLVPAPRTYRPAADPGIWLSSMYRGKYI